MRHLLIAGLLLGATAAHADPGGTDFGTQAQTMFRVAACGGDAAIPDAFNKKTVDAHCKEMGEIYAWYKKNWMKPAMDFMHDNVPKNAPSTVVYPFGGGDLSSALSVYPDATEITTISLEAAGDVRVIDTKASKLSNDFDEVGNILRRLYREGYSSTKSLQAASHLTLPGTVMMALAGMAVHDMEPVQLRYFDIEPDGKLTYLTNEQLDKRAEEYAATKRGQTPPKKITHYWYEQDSPYANVEILYRPKGDAKAPLRTYRHIVANLDDDHTNGDDRILKHLKLKKKVAVMTKGASFLLWYDDFKNIRDYLLANTAWMVSDASGIPPSYAGPAGFEQLTFGDFQGPYFVIDEKNTRAEFIKLWKDNPHKDLAFRFGYPDSNNHNHLMITRPKQ